jgi:predicted Zn-dependent protease
MRRGIAVVVTAAVSLLAACTHRQEIKTETQLAKSLISDQQEDELGSALEADLQKEHVKYLQDPQVNAYVEGIANKIFVQAKKDRPGVNWHVHVIDDPKTVNAFAAPGGHLFVYSGLLLAADNDAELVGVLSHETGHVVARHAARKLVNMFGLQALSQLAVGQNPGLLEQLAVGVAGNGYLLAHSRGEETEADEYGARYAAGAGYDPHALITFFGKLKAKEGHVPQFLTYLSDHPATSARIQHLQGYISRHHLTGATVGNDLAPLKARIPGAAQSGG